MTDLQWSQVTLAFSEGGLGLDSPMTHAPAAGVAGLVNWLLAPEFLKPEGLLGGVPEGAFAAVPWLHSLVGEHTLLGDWSAAQCILFPEREHADQKSWSKLCSRAG